MSFLTRFIALFYNKNKKIDCSIFEYLSNTTQNIYQCIAMFMYVTLCFFFYRAIFMSLEVHEEGKFIVFLFGRFDLPISLRTCQ